MTEDIKELIESALSSAGFTPSEDYAGSLQADHPAFWRIKKISLGELSTGRVTECSADFEISVRIMGAKRDFSDSAALKQMAQKAVQTLIFSSEMIVKAVNLGEIYRNMQTGRLEFPLDVTVCASIKKGA
jgi:hypothetical protein